MTLWRNDQTLRNALELAKSLLAPVEVMNALWPCPRKLYYLLFFVFFICDSSTTTMRGTEKSSNFCVYHDWA